MDCDMHVHSKRSFDCAMELKTIALRAKSKGLSAVVIADHNIPPADNLPDELYGVRIFPGAEYSTDLGHVLALFAPDPLDEHGLNDEKGRYNWKETVDVIHQMGGIAILAHPFAYGKSPTAEQMSYFDGIEICNSRAGYLLKGDANRNAEAAAPEGLFQTAGSDAHLPFEIGRSFTRLDCSEDCTQEEFVQALSGARFFSRPTSPSAMARSQIYKAIRLQEYRIIPKNMLKYGYGVLCRFFPRLFGIRPYRREL